MHWLTPLIVPLSILTAQTPPKVWTTILPDPDSGRAYEPFLAVDPINPKRIIVASMVKDGRVGQWLWQSEDGGRFWTSRPMPSFVVAGRSAEAGPDVMVDVAGDGATLLGAMGGFVAAPNEGGIFVGKLG